MFTLYCNIFQRISGEVIRKIFKRMSISSPKFAKKTPHPQEIEKNDNSFLFTLASQKKFANDILLWCYEKHFFDNWIKALSFASPASKLIGNDTRCQLYFSVPTNEWRWTGNEIMELKGTSSLWIKKELRNSRRP